MHARPGTSREAPGTFLGEPGTPLGDPGLHDVSHRHAWEALGWTKSTSRPSTGHTCLQQGWILAWPGHGDYDLPDPREREELSGELYGQPFDFHTCEERFHGTVDERRNHGNFGKLWRSIWFRLLVSMGQLNRTYHTLLKLLRSWIDDFERTGSKWTWRTQRDDLGRNPARLYGPNTKGHYEFERAVVRFWDSHITYQEYWGFFTDLVGEWILKKYRPGKTFAEFDSWCWAVPVAPLLALQRLNWCAFRARMWQAQRDSKRSTRTSSLLQVDFRDWTWEEIFNRFPPPWETQGNFVRFYNPDCLGKLRLVDFC